MPKVITDVSQKILKAAAQIYHEDGFESISMRRIAELSGLAVGTLYNRFEDKEALLAQVLAGDIKNIKQSMIENVYGKPPEEALYAAILTFMRRTMDESHDIIRYVLDMRSNQEYVARILAGACNEIRDLLEEVIVRVYARHRTQLGKESAAMLSDMALSMIQVVSRYGAQSAETRSTLVYGMLVSHARDREARAEERGKRKGPFGRRNPGSES